MQSDAKTVSDIQEEGDIAYIQGWMKENRARMKEDGVMLLNWHNGRWRIFKKTNKTEKYVR